MSNGFRFDEETAVTSMTHATALNDVQASATLYAVICTTAGGGLSHGGFIVCDLPEALAIATQANEQAPEGHECRYIPIALGLSYATFLRTMGGIASMGEEPS